jgi:regulator of sigma E protease
MSGEVDPSEPRSLASKNAGIRILVLSAGSIMNALLPLLLFSIAFMVPHNAVIGDVVVREVSADSPAASAGIEPGDMILSINNRPVNSTIDITRYLQLYLGREISVTLGRGDTTEEVFLTPRWKPPEGEGVTGMRISMPDPTIIRQSYPFWEAIPLGFRECGDTFVLFKNAILGLFSGAMQFQVGGPVAIAQMTGEVAQAGFSPLLEFAAFLSINLAIINIFPLPALDGGRIIFVLVELVRRGKRIAPRTENLIHGIGFVLLIGAILAITYQDIARIVSGGSLLP